MEANPENCTSQKAIRLSPLDPGMGFDAMRLCLAHVGAGCPEVALPWGYKALGEKPRYFPVLRALMLALVELGRLEEARRLASQNGTSRYPPAACGVAVGGGSQRVRENGLASRDETQR